MNQVFYKISPLGFHWETQDPFLFCVHHNDNYPKGNIDQGPAAPLEGRQLGQDFDEDQAWRMYHGRKVPGFPEHPHRGFETVTVVLDGTVDHFDSSGASGRYSNGDVQWMTAGSGLQHSEMFPLTNEDKPNPLHLFQIWLNLPMKNKFVKPHYKMLWHEEIPQITQTDENGNDTELLLIAGTYGDQKAVAPPPDSWAYDEGHHLKIWLVKMAPNAKFEINETSKTVNRSLYLYKGKSLKINDMDLPVNHSAQIKPCETLLIENGPEPCYWLLLQGEPIDEPVVSYGPFVMNTESEIQDAYNDYRRTRFGGWPWSSSDPVNKRDSGRFASYSDGTMHLPPVKP